MTPHHCLRTIGDLRASSSQVVRNDVPTSKHVLLLLEVPYFPTNFPVYFWALVKACHAWSNTPRSITVKAQNNNQDQDPFRLRGE